MDYEEDSFCDICGRDPCVWVSDQETIINLFNTRYGNIPVEGSCDERKKQQASHCFYLYKEYTSHIYGVLGKGVRIRHPTCIIQGIQDLALTPTEHTPATFMLTTTKQMLVDDFIVQKIFAPCISYIQKI